eukprot:gene11821-33942_t
MVPLLQPSLSEAGAAGFATMRSVVLKSSVKISKGKIAQWRGWRNAGYRSSKFGGSLRTQTADRADLAFICETLWVSTRAQAPLAPVHFPQQHNQHHSGKFRGGWSQPRHTSAGQETLKRPVDTAPPHDPLSGEKMEQDICGQAPLQHSQHHGGEPFRGWSKPQHASAGQSTYDRPVDVAPPQVPVDSHQQHTQHHSGKSFRGWSKPHHSYTGQETFERTVDTAPTHQLLNGDERKQDICGQTPMQHSQHHSGKPSKAWSQPQRASAGQDTTERMIDTTSPPVPLKGEGRKQDIFVRPLLPVPPKRGREPNDLGWIPAQKSEQHKQHCHPNSEQENQHEQNHNLRQHHHQDKRKKQEGQLSPSTAPDGRSPLVQAQQSGVTAPAPSTQHQKRQKHKGQLSPSFAPDGCSPLVQAQQSGVTAPAPSTQHQKRQKHEGQLSPSFAPDGRSPLVQAQQSGVTAPAPSTQHQNRQKQEGQLSPSMAPDDRIPLVQAQHSGVTAPAPSNTGSHASLSVAHVQVKHWGGNPQGPTPAFNPVSVVPHVQAQHWGGNPPAPQMVGNPPSAAVNHASVVTHMPAPHSGCNPPAPSTAHIPARGVTDIDVQGSGCNPAEPSTSPPTNAKTSLRRELSQWIPHPGVAAAFTSLHRELSQWIPHPGVAAAFVAKGVKSLYPWQAGALECGEDGSNLVYCAPTSGGKSLVAEILMIRRMHAWKTATQHHIMQQAAARGRGGRPVQLPPIRALVVLPYISIVNEKTDHLSHVLAPMGCRVKGYCGMDSGCPLSRKDEGLAVCTIEKANVAINRLVQEGRMFELCCIIVDEPTLELCLSKIMHAVTLGKPGGPRPQIICMSATMGKVYRKLSISEMSAATAEAAREKEAGAKTTQAEIGFVSAKNAKVTKGNPDMVEPFIELRELPASCSSRDKDGLVHLIAEVASEQHSTLVFCAGRAACQSCASLIADLLPGQLGQEGAAPADKVAARLSLIEELRVAMGGHSNTLLERLIADGVGYHHAGLTCEERNCVEAGFRSGAILVLAATSTLAAGINLPARRVILRSLWQGAGPVSRHLSMSGHISPEEEVDAATVSQAHVLTAALVHLFPFFTVLLLNLIILYFIREEADAATEEVDAVSQAHVLTAKPVRGRGEGTQPGNDPSLVKNEGAAAGSEDKSNLCAEVGARNDKRKTTSQGNKAEGPLQRMLLESIANGSAISGCNIDTLIRSTLMSRQADYKSIHQATKTALGGLRQKQLISLKSKAVADEVRPGGVLKGAADKSKGGQAETAIESATPVQAHWGVTDIGGAVYDSSLPMEMGLELYFRLKKAQSQPFVLSASVAEVEGVSMMYVERMLSGGRPVAAETRKHSRFAAAWLLSQLMCEGDVHHLEEMWGKPEALSRQGISRGEMQRLQGDLGKWAGFATMICASSG